MRRIRKQAQMSTIPVGSQQLQIIRFLFGDFNRLNDEILNNANL